MGVDDVSFAGRVKVIVADQLLVDINKITDESSFVHDLGADSIDTVELIMEFEDQFDIEISDEEAEKIATVGEAIQGIRKLLDLKNQENQKKRRRS